MTVPEWNGVSHVRVDSGARPTPRLWFQPPLGLELVRVFTPDGLIATNRRFGNQDNLNET